MSSEAQVRANRENATKSTGPRTVQGKARSSQNAVKHALHSRMLVMPDENVEEFDQLTRELMSSYGAQNVAEELIVEQIVIATWKLRRLQRYERQLYDEKYQQQVAEAQAYRRKPVETKFNTLNIRRAISSDLGSIEELEDRLHNRIDRAHRELANIRKLRKELRKEEQENRENEANSEVSEVETEAYDEPIAREPVEPEAPMRAEPRTSAETGAEEVAPTPDLRL